GARLLAAPVDGVALRPGPPLGGPHEAPGVGPPFDAPVGLLAGREGEAEAGPDPADVELADPGPRPHLLLLVGQPGRRPQAEGDVTLGEAGRDPVEVLVAAAVAVVDQHPAEGDAAL